MNETTKLFPEIIITDIAIRGINYFEFLSEIKQIGSARNVPVILFTTSSTRKEFASEQIGATAFCIKPFTIEGLNL